MESLRFEFDDPQAHAERGYQLIHGNELFSAAAAMIRFHHTSWDAAGGEPRALPPPLALGLSAEERGMIEIARLPPRPRQAGRADRHPREARLAPGEFNLVRRHPYDTHRILGEIESLRTIAKWAALHHECLNGTGYPFHYAGENLPLGARIMTVADIFTALSEDRPYRPGLGKTEIVRILDDMVRGRLLDGGIVSLVRSEYGTLDAIRRCAQAP